MKDEKRSKFLKNSAGHYVLSGEERRLLSRTATRNRAYPEGRHCKLKVTKKYGDRVVQTIAWQLHCQVISLVCTLSLRLQSNFWLWLPDTFLNEWCTAHWAGAGMARGESSRLPPMCPGFDSRTRRHMRVEFVAGSLLCPERFLSGYPGFPLSSKTNISKFQFDLGMHGQFWTSCCELLGAPWVNKFTLEKGHLSV